MSQAAHKYDVIVIGGGLAGLSAANLLKEHGVKAVLVEAAGRLGGRVATNPGLAEYPLELGAEFVHGPTNALMDLVKKYKLETEHIFTWAHGDGGPSENPVRGGLAYYFLGKEKKMLRYDDPDPEMHKLHEALWNLEEIDLSQFSEKDTVEDYLKKCGINNPSWLKMADAGFANTVCNTLSELPLIPAAKLFRAFADDGEGEYRILPSWQPLLDALAKGVDFRLQWEAKKVVWPGANQQGHVEVFNTKGERLLADRVIVAVPPPMLAERDIEFFPPLPSEKMAALKAIKFEPCFKIAFRFKRRFWPKDLHGVICSDCVVPEWWSLPTHDAPKGQQWKDHVLTGFTCGYYSRHLAALPRSEMKRQALAQLDAMFGTKDDPKPATDAFDDMATKDWTGDRFIRGGYSSCRMGNTEEDRKRIAAPVGDYLFFAGEHTHLTRYMVAHAAIETGQAASRVIVERMRFHPRTGTCPRSRL